MQHNIAQQTKKWCSSVHPTPGTWQGLQVILLHEDMTTHQWNMSTPVQPNRHDNDDDSDNEGGVEHASPALTCHA
jgi:hypothetical protein